MNHVQISTRSFFMLPLCENNSEGITKFRKPDPPMETDCGRINTAESTPEVCGVGLLQESEAQSNYRWLQNMLYLQ